MYEQFKVYHTFMDKVNVIAKMILGVLLFAFVIFVHNFDWMLYLSILMFIFMMIFSGVRIKLIAAFVSVMMLFSFTSSLFMIFYGDGTTMLFEWGIIHISKESLFRGLHLSLRTLTVSFFGLCIAFTSEVVKIFYSLMQHLKVKPKYAYAFMAVIRMVPLMFESYFQLKNALKMRYHVIDSKQYRGLKRIKHILIPLLSQNIRRAHRLSVAMEKKGFHDGKRSYYYVVPFSYRDIILSALIIIMIIGSYCLANYFPITHISDVR
ncbi:energy-coupling factor transporter transmembrane component T family protein [Macrococcoides caseolyticum]|uniref:energy-coupling factor transporter transmembrane component T family protein n=1 Tax=Macrococcoides caseolyticum TaxID=69966 RepID=UPI001F28F6CE|nr:energy-coupling factor transporter transmembrane component T [Macrococcus caseolyticus]MCE4956547.1 energy-coupling factor transporter transmembrane protein EcfT [Macrococcus caseolyticus]